jgi:DNA-3-methyladenine glycosylase I
MADLVRCAWVSDDLYALYHDFEWGVPVHDDHTWFEFILLEGAQAGLSWSTILRRRSEYRRAFDDFDYTEIAGYGADRVATLMANSGIIRNRAKILAAISNARAFLAVREEFGSFDGYIWRFVDGHPRVNAWNSISELPAITPEAVIISKDLKRRGFTFVGPTICYALMQATGLVNDHTVDCFRYRQLLEEGTP